MTFDPEAVRTFERTGWDRAASHYESSFAKASRQFITGLLDAAAVEPGTRVLDIACGPGLVAIEAAARGAIVTGLDFSLSMLERARANAPALTFDEGDAEALPYPDASFERVVSNFGIHHVPRPALALRQAFRVLRPGGRMAFSIWADPGENIAWKLLFDAVARHGDPGAAKAPAPGGGFSTAAHCIEAMQQAGFAGCETRVVRRLWRHADAAALVAALQAGTARMAAMISAQSPAAMPSILTDIANAAEPYRQPNGIGVPIAAVIAAGVKT